MPGIGPLLGAEFLAAIGSDLTDFASPDALGLRGPGSGAARFREAEPTCIDLVTITAVSSESSTCPP
jgi:hypothetical protein